MHFDDRLGTVLRLSMGGAAGARIQYRQLIDLLGTAPTAARSDVLDAAYVRLAELDGAIDAASRAAAIGQGGSRLRSPRLIASLAAADPAIARAALQQARLSPEEWRDLVPALPPSARVHLRERGDLAPEVLILLGRLGINDRALPPAVSRDAEDDIDTAPITRVSNTAGANDSGEIETIAGIAADTVSIMPPPPVPAGESGIGAIVRRIEAYRRAKQVIEPVAANDSPRLPLGEDADAIVHRAKAFDFATDANGHIVWSDPGVLPMVAGVALGGEKGDHELSLAMRRRQPIRAREIALAGAEAISGRWQVDAAPWFDPLTGSFSGYRGRMRRPATKAPLIPPVTDTQSDRIRQMLHELRTPVNAIQGFAEVIQQQLFGPAPHDYRALAAAIAGDAARMLAAFEELERLARLDSGAISLEPGETDLAGVVAVTVGQLSAHGRPRGSGFDLRIKDEAVPVALERLEVERIVWRLLATLAGATAPGETLKITLRLTGQVARLDVALPTALAKIDDEGIFETAPGALPQTIAAGVFGIGFALRLARAEARSVGGELRRKDDRIRLTLPGLTHGLADHTEAV